MHSSHSTILRQTLLALLDGAAFATALRDSGRPGRLRLPDDSRKRAELVETHVSRGTTTLDFRASDAAWRERVAAVVLAAYCPRADGACSWVAIDLDAASGHGPRGLADPAHAARCFAEQAYAAGLGDGLLVARSRGGRGYHVWLILPESVALSDAVVGVAALAAAAFNVASRDAADYGAPHAFLRADASLARPGDAGACELLPRATARPAFGWGLTLPAAGAFAARGGGAIVDPFTERPAELPTVPRCDPRCWQRFIAESRAARAARQRPGFRDPRPVVRPKPRPGSIGPPPERISARTRDFLEGRVAPGSRNIAAFAAACNLIGVGVEEREAERLLVTGALACGMSEREARTCFSSAVGTLRRKGRSR